MKIVYIHQYFTTNKGTGGTRSYDVAKHMVQAGHQVYMICGIAATSGLAKMPWYKLLRRDNIDGIHCIVCNVPYSGNMGSRKRIFSFAWFVVLATFASLLVSRPDLIFATSTPLFVGIPGLISSKIKRVPFIFEVRDLWPESFIIGGAATGDELYIKFMAWIERLCYKNAKKILLVSSGFEKRPEKLKTILLGADGSLFNDVEPDTEFLTKHNLNGRKIAVFTGAHGRANGLDYVLDAADYSRQRRDIAYVLIGDGREKRRLIERAKEKGLDNVVFVEPVSKTQLAKILALCDIGLMILKHIEGGRPVTPNKIFDYMFSAMPSVVNFQGPTVDMVNNEKCGLFADPLDPKSLSEKVEYLVDNPQIAKEMGENGRKAAYQKYDRKVISMQIIETFEEVLAGLHS